MVKLILNRVSTNSWTSSFLWYFLTYFTVCALPTIDTCALKRIDAISTEPTILARDCCTIIEIWIGQRKKQYFFKIKLYIILTCIQKQQNCIHRITAVNDLLWIQYPTWDKNVINFKSIHCINLNIKLYILFHTRWTNILKIVPTIINVHHQQYFSSVRKYTNPHKKKLGVIIYVFVTFYNLHWSIMLDLKQFLKLSHSNKHQDFWQQKLI